jgi:hypothetical protein
LLTEYEADRGSAHGANEYGSTGRLKRQIISGYRSSITIGKVQSAGNIGVTNTELVV